MNLDDLRRKRREEALAFIKNCSQEELAYYIKFFGQHHNKMYRKRLKLRYAGLVLIGLVFGQTIGYAYKILVNHQILKWTEWVYVGISILFLCAAPFIFLHNERRLKIFKAAGKNMLGVVRTRPRSHLREHHMEQALAALTEWENLLVSRSKKNENTAETDTFS